MITQSYKALTSRPILVLAALLVGLMLYAASGTVYAQDATIPYAENDTIPVATLQASDEDDDDIEWTLSGMDASAFDIGTSSGVLTFKSPPDFEKKPTYSVTAEAAGGTIDLTVNITNVEEPGSVKLDQIQPQVEIEVEASVSDPDEGVTGTTWQWAKSIDMNSWTDIENETSAGYTPVIDDIDYYLRASATYTDTLGDGKTAEMVSERAVEPKTPVNAFPAFPKEDFNEDGVDETGEPEDTSTDPDTDAAPFLREVDENTGADMNIGNPIMATDADMDDLLYKLTDNDGGTDGDSTAFDIDDRTGQIKTKAPLDFEVANDDVNADEDNDDTYEVMVTATDPSLAAKTALVEITVKDLNEAPTFTANTSPSAWTAPEVDSTADSPQTPTLTVADDPAPTTTSYAATDADEINNVEDEAILSIEGPDEAKFDLNAQGGLIFAADHTPDYETQKEYSITIVAADSNTQAEGRTPMSSSRDVTIKLTDVKEGGTVSYDQVQPQVGVALTASLSDPDMGVTGTTWQWASTEVGGANDCSGASFQDDDDIMGATSATYTPKAAGMCLQATATYRDNASDEDVANTPADESLNMADETITLAVEAKTTGNARPTFTEEDMDEDDVKETGAADAPFMRNVKEKTGSGMDIGNPVPGADKDEPTDELIYTLGGADASSFDITESGTGAGQLKTKADLDYETQSSYMLEVTATDPSLASAMAMVMVTVEDVNEKAKITGDDPEDFPENGTGTVATFMATDEDSQDDADMWGLDGADKGSFDIAGGVLTFKDPPDFEDQSSYAVIITVTDRDVVADKAVTVKITNMDEDGSVSLSQIQPQVEIEVEAEASDPDMGVSGTMWQWAKSMDMSAWTDIDGETSMAYTPVVADEGYYLRATATYTDTLGDEKTAEMVSERAVEPKTTSNAVPDFGKEDFDDNDTDEDGLTDLTAFLRDVDENTAAGMNVGNPIAATDDDNDDLLYTLTDTDDGTDGDSAKFTINERTGQIKTKVPLDFEVDGADPNADENDDETYGVKVTATDPSLAAKTVLVNIRVQDLNEAPDFDDNDAKAVRADENQNTNIEVDDETGSTLSAYDCDRRGRCGYYLHRRALAGRRRRESVHDRRPRQACLRNRGRCTYAGLRVEELVLDNRQGHRRQDR